VADDKLQIAIYWGAACGGCDVSILDTDEFILDIDKAADIRLWPIATDGKYKDIEALADGELDVVIMNGAVRNSENEHIALLLRDLAGEVCGGRLEVVLGGGSHTRLATYLIPPVIETLADLR